jgi:hypothetical protein
MKLPLLILLLLISFNTWAKDQAFVDTEDNQIVSIFNKPGKNWKNCAKDPQCRPLGWPDNTAKINVLSPTKKLKVEDPYTGKMTEEEYVFVEYSYTRIEKDKNGKPTGKEWPQAGQGWIDASYLSYTKQKSFYGEDCPPTEKKTCSAPNAVQELVDKFKPIEKSNSNKSVKEVADSLSGVVGQCVINPAKPPTKYAAGNPFDSMVLPSLEKKRPSKILGPDGKQVTLQQLADIDALARTLYGEMAGCYKHGLQYPMAVAKIASNRANAPEKTKKAFLGQDSAHNDKKDDLARVVTTPSQFNVWKKYNEDGTTNGSLTLALCPPSDPNKDSWQKFKPGKDELAIWENTLRIATEAVLFPNKFNNRTSEVKSTYYDYNSGPADPWGYHRVYPSIDGRKVSRVACMQIWKR